MVYFVPDYKKFAALVDYLASSIIGYSVDDKGEINIYEELTQYEIRKIEEIINGSTSP